MEKEMKTRIVYYFIGVVISALALTAVASLSSYAHETDNTLMATQAQLQALQKDYDQLKADHESLSNDYDQATSDLEAANSKVASLESELKTAKKQNEEFEQTIKIAKLNMDALDGLFDDSISLNEMEARIDATGNSELSRKWNAVNSQDSLASFIVYLVHAAWQSLN
jgi:chromosome segregation ATPase